MSQECKEDKATRTGTFKQIVVEPQLQREAPKKPRSIPEMEDPASTGVIYLKKLEGRDKSAIGDQDKP